jgi:hypothetical protein
MFRRIGVVLAMMWLVGAVPLTPVQAQVNIDIRVGSNLNHGRRISCLDGQRMLERRGFRSVRALDCRGRFFNYTGRRQGHWWWIDVRASDGRIVRLDRRR